jgi:hypothetical protein
MASKKTNVNVNRSQVIREFFEARPNSKAGEVITALSGKGVPVSADLVYAVKRKMRISKGRRKQTASSTASAATNGQAPNAAQPGVVAQRNGKPNKTEQVREYLEANPSATGTQAINALSRKGVRVTSSLVYSIKAKMKNRKGPAKQLGKRATTVTAKGAVASTSGSNDVASTVRKVKGLASEVGGLKKLMALVEALSE